MSSLLKKFCVSAIVVVATATNLFAGSFIVSNTADSGNGSLRQAILNANAHCGGAITFSRVKGVITLQSPLPAITKDTFLLGPGKSVLTVSGAGQFRVFSFGAGATGSVSGLTIANGFTMSMLTIEHASGIDNSGRLLVEDCTISNCQNFATAGGGVFNQGRMDLDNCLIVHCGSLGSDSGVEGGAVFNSGRLAMQHCVVSNCVASRGGGILNEGTAAVDWCVIKNCGNDFSEGDGAGIYHFSGNLVLTDCVISNCSAGFDGGGIAAFGNLQLWRTIIADNSALEGGGLYFGDGTCSLHDCTVSFNNDFGFGGGGIKNLGTLAMDGCTVNGNSSSIGGGGIQNLDQLALTNCTISGNFCFASKGAAILNANGDFNGTTFSNVTCQITDCTIASNKATVTGGIGGIENDGGAVSLRTTILADNAPADFSGALNSEGFNLILNTNGCALSGNLAGNIFGKNPLLGPLRNNGGFTMTEALLAGSPAIGAGPRHSPPRFDQRGVVRPPGMPQDIGAYQAPKGHTHFVSLAHTGGGVQITVNGNPGSHYAIQRASSPAGRGPRFTNIVADPNGNGTCMDRSPAAGNAYYRSVLR